MLAWICENAATIIVSAVLAVIAILIIIHIIRCKKSGKSSCGGNCSGCAMRGCCGKK